MTHNFPEKTIIAFLVIAILVIVVCFTISNDIPGSKAVNPDTWESLGNPHFCGAIYRKQVGNHWIYTNGHGSIFVLKSDDKETDKNDKH